MNNREIGVSAERLAVEYLNHIGLSTVAKNAVIGGVEIDALLLDGETLVLLEVKFGRGAVMRVDAKKRQRMLRAGAYLSKISGRNLRFDVIEVKPNGAVVHYPGAFDHSAKG